MRRHRLYDTTLTLVCAVATVGGHKPLIGLREEVEERWKKLKAKFGVKEKAQRLLARSASAAGDEPASVDMMRFRRGSDVGSVLSKFRNMSQQAEQEVKEDVFHKDWKPPKLDKNNADYGRPKAGSLTEKRGIAAGHHVGKEIIRLCEVIDEYGEMCDDGLVRVTFGQLFNVYVYISDKLVGMLMRARRHKLVHFDGEMLYQRRDDDAVITLQKSLKAVRQLYSQSDDPAACLRKE